MSNDKLTTFLRLFKSGIIFCRCLYIMRPTAVHQSFFRSLKSAFCLSTSPEAPCWRFPILAMTMYEQARHCSFGLTKTCVGFVLSLIRLLASWLPHSLEVICNLFNPNRSLDHYASKILVYLLFPNIFYFLIALLPIFTT